MRVFGDGVRIFRLTLSALLIALTLWQWGQASWIFAKAQLAQVLIKHAWSETLDSGQTQKPWPWADTFPVARLVSEASDDDLWVLAGADGSSLAFGPGKVVGSGGEQGWVIAGHRDTHFQFLRQLNNGERLQLQTEQGDWQSYQVKGKEIVDSDKSSLTIPGQDVLLLVTCYPFDALSTDSSLRWVVRAEAIENAPVITL